MVAIFVGKSLIFISKMFFNMLFQRHVFVTIQKKGAIYSLYFCCLYVLKHLVCTRILSSPLNVLPPTQMWPTIWMINWRGFDLFYPSQRRALSITLLGMSLTPTSDKVERTQTLEKAGLDLSHNSAIYAFSEFVFYLSNGDNQSYFSGLSKW